MQHLRGFTYHLAPAMSSTLTYRDCCDGLAATRSSSSTSPSNPSRSSSTDWARFPVVSILTYNDAALRGGNGWRFKRCTNVHFGELAVYVGLREEDYAMQQDEDTEEQHGGASTTEWWFARAHACAWVCGGGDPLLTAGLCCRLASGGGRVGRYCAASLSVATMPSFDVSGAAHPATPPSFPSPPGHS